VIFMIKLIKYKDMQVKYIKEQDQLPMYLLSWKELIQLSVLKPSILIKL